MIQFFSTHQCNEQTSNNYLYYFIILVICSTDFGCTPSIVSTLLPVCAHSHKQTESLDEQPLKNNFTYFTPENIYYFVVLNIQFTTSITGFGLMCDKWNERETRAMSTWIGTTEYRSTMREHTQHFGSTTVSFEMCQSTGRAFDTYNDFLNRNKYNHLHMYARYRHT